MTSYYFRFSGLFQPLFWLEPNIFMCSLYFSYKSAFWSFLQTHVMLLQSPLVECHTIYFIKASLKWFRYKMALNLGRIFRTLSTFPVNFSLRVILSLSLFLHSTYSLKLVSSITYGKQCNSLRCSLSLHTENLPLSTVIFLLPFGRFFPTISALFTFTLLWRRMLITK